MVIRAVTIAALVMVAPDLGVAQATQDPAIAASASAQPAPPAAAPANPEALGFTYAPEGRRDPFVNLLRSGGSTFGSAAGSRPPGLAGLGTAEVTLKGTIRSQTGFVGILLGVDGKAYIVRPGDRLLDGTVRSISEDALVILQQVNDPLSLEKQREVRKTLRGDEAA